MHKQPFITALVTSLAFAIGLPFVAHASALTVTCPMSLDVSCTRGGNTDEGTFDSNYYCSVQGDYKVQAQTTDANSVNTSQAYSLRAYSYVSNGVVSDNAYQASVPMTRVKLGTIESVSNVTLCYYGGVDRYSARVTMMTQEVGCGADTRASSNGALNQATCQIS